MEVDADMASVPVTEGDSDGLLAVEVVAGAGVSVKTCIDEMVLDAGIVPVPVAEGADDGLSPAEAVAVVGVPVRAGDSSSLSVDAQDFTPGLVPGLVWRGDRVCNEQEQVHRRNWKRGWWT